MTFSLGDKEKHWLVECVHLSLYFWLFIVDCLMWMIWVHLKRTPKNSGSWRRIKSNKGPLLKWSWLFSHCYTVLASPNGCLSTRSLPYVSKQPERCKPMSFRHCNRPKSPGHDVISSGVSKTPPIQPTLVQKTLKHQSGQIIDCFTWPRFPLK